LITQKKPLNLDYATLIVDGGLLILIKSVDSAILLVGDSFIDS